MCMFKVKKIGKIFFPFLVMSYASICADVQVQLALLDSSGKRTKELVADQIGILQVTVSGQDEGIIMPEIERLSEFILIEKRFVSTVHLVINGVRTDKKIYQFTIQAPKRTGVYEVGPAQVKTHKQRFTSHPLKIKVIHETAQSAEEPRLTLMLDKKEVYPGEPFLCTIRFYPNKEASLEGVSQPDFSGFTSQKLEGPFAGKETISDGEISFIEWRTVLNASKPGEYTINPVTAVYKMQRKKSGRQNVGLDLFDHFFSQIDQRQLSSNAQRITVHELPPTKNHVDGIGRFEKVEAFLEPSIAMQGEGVVLKLIVYAKDNNMDLLHFPQLNLPEGLKYYESKSYVESAPDYAKSKKIFEYILQGSQPGDVTIPKQKVHVFDYELKKYQTFESNELSLTIKKETAKKPISVPSVPHETTAPDSKNLLPIVKDGKDHYQDTRSIPLYIWLFLCSMPWCIFLVRYTWIRVRTRIWSHPSLKRKMIFSFTHNQLVRLEKAHIPEALYDLFRGWYAQYYSVSMYSVTHDMLKNVIRNIPSLSDYEQRAYAEFIDTLVECSFGKDRKRDMKKYQKLFIEAKEWLATLEKNVS